MGLSDVFKNGAKTAITAFGDVAQSADYWSKTSTSYSSTGTVATTYSTVAGVKVIIEGFRVAGNSGVRTLAADFDVKQSDQQALIAAVDLPSITPNKDDVIVLDTSVSWNVVNVFTDPATALWTCQIRKS